MKSLWETASAAAASETFSDQMKQKAGLVFADVAAASWADKYKVLSFQFFSQYLDGFSDAILKFAKTDGVQNAAALRTATRNVLKAYFNAANLSDEVAEKLGRRMLALMTTIQVFAHDKALHSIISKTSGGLISESVLNQFFSRSAASAHQIQGSTKTFFKAADVTQSLFVWHSALCATITTSSIVNELMASQIDARDMELKTKAQIKSACNRLKSNVKYKGDDWCRREDGQKEIKSLTMLEQNANETQCQKRFADVWIDFAVGIPVYDKSSYKVIRNWGGSVTKVKVTLNGVIFRDNRPILLRIQETRNFPAPEGSPETWITAAHLDPDELEKAALGCRDGYK